MRYLNIILIICIMSAIPLTLCGCANQQKTSKIKMVYKSKVPKSAAHSVRCTAANVIDLSDGRQVNFGANLGPSDPSGPRFDMRSVDNY